MFVYLVVQVAQVSSAALRLSLNEAPSDNMRTLGSHEENRVALLQSEQHDEAKPELEAYP